MYGVVQILPNIIILTIILLGEVSGHGRMVEPPMRSSLWRYGYKVPPNYNDNELNCGGLVNLHDYQGGNCGVCGDPWQGPRDNEAGGRYAIGLVTRRYQVDQYIDVSIDLTANHGGSFEFRLCPQNNPRVPVTQECLDQNLLYIWEYGTEYNIISDSPQVQSISLKVQLPYGMTCGQCVLQWRWVGAQHTGPDGFGGECHGCGAQEMWHNCADIAIGTYVMNVTIPDKIDSPEKTTNAQPASTQTSSSSTTVDDGLWDDFSAFYQIASAERQKSLLSLSRTYLSEANGRERLHKLVKFMLYMNQINPPSLANAGAQTPETSSLQVAPQVSQIDKMTSASSFLSQQQNTDTSSSLGQLLTAVGTIRAAEKTQEVVSDVVGNVEEVVEEVVEPIVEKVAEIVKPVVEEVVEEVIEPAVEVVEAVIDSEVVISGVGPQNYAAGRTIQEEDLSDIVDEIVERLEDVIEHGRSNGDSDGGSSGSDMSDHSSNQGSDDASGSDGLSEEIGQSGGFDGRSRSEASRNVGSRSDESSDTDESSGSDESRSGGFHSWIMYDGSQETDSQDSSSSESSESGYGRLLKTSIFQDSIDSWKSALASMYGVNTENSGILNDNRQISNTQGSKSAYLWAEIVDTDTSESSESISASRDSESGDRSSSGGNSGLSNLGLWDGMDGMIDSESRDRSRETESSDSSRENESRDRSRETESSDRSRENESRDRSRETESSDRSRENESRDRSSESESGSRSRSSDSRSRSTESGGRSGLLNDGSGSRERSESLSQDQSSEGISDVIDESSLTTDSGNPSAAFASSDESGDLGSKRLRWEIMRIFYSTQSHVTVCSGGRPSTCAASAAWVSSPDIGHWCSSLCPYGYCPTAMCECTCPTPLQKCRALSTWKDETGAIGQWCSDNCPGENCPAFMCTCDP